MRCLAAHPRVDLVEDGLAARDGRQRERDAGARRRTPSRRPGRATAVRTDEEDRLVAAAGPSSRSLSSTWNSPSPIPRSASSAATSAAKAGLHLPSRLGERPSPQRRTTWTRRHALARALEGALRAGTFELGHGGHTPLEELVVGRGPVAPTDVREPVEPLLDGSRPRGVGVERLGESAHVARDLRQADDELAQLARGGLELGCQALEQGERALGCCCESARRRRRPARSPLRPRRRPRRGRRRGGCARARREAAPPPGSSPSVSSTSASSSARRSRSVSAPRSSSSTRRVVADSARQPSRASVRRTPWSGPR